MIPQEYVPTYLSLSCWHGLFSAPQPSSLQLQATPQARYPSWAMLVVYQEWRLKKTCQPPITKMLYSLPIHAAESTFLQDNVVKPQMKEIVLIPLIIKNEGCDETSQPSSIET